VLTVTESACRALKGVLENAETQPGQFLRLVEEEGHYHLTLGVEQEGDQVVKHEGETVLLIDPETSAGLEGLCLDLQQTPGGPRLAFIPKEEQEEQEEESLS